jgi:hypothetical protein
LNKNNKEQKIELNSIYNEDSLEFNSQEDEKEVLESLQYFNNSNLKEYYE